MILTVKGSSIGAAIPMKITQFYASKVLSSKKKDASLNNWWVAFFPPPYPNNKQRGSLFLHTLLTIHIKL